MTYLAIALVLGSTALHAGWNMAAHARRGEAFFFVHMCAWSVTLSLAPAAAVWWWTGHVLGLASWGYAAASGLCLSVYFLGLTQGYRAGDFTLVYPLARALPIVLLVAFDLSRGQTIEAGGYAGMSLVVAGCLFLLTNGRAALPAHVSWRALAWVAVIAVGTAGYTSIDKVAMEGVVEQHWALAVQYGCAQFGLALPGLWLALRWLHGGVPRDARPIAHIALLVAVAHFSAYLLVLVAYQLVEQASYVLAMRQFSIAIGAALAAWLLHEPAPRARLAAAVLITVGVMMLVLTLAR